MPKHISIREIHDLIASIADDVMNALFRKEAKSIQQLSVSYPWATWLLYDIRSDYSGSKLPGLNLSVVQFSVTARWIPASNPVGDSAWTSTVIVTFTPGRTVNC